MLTRTISNNYTKVLSSSLFKMGCHFALILVAFLCCLVASADQVVYAGNRLYANIVGVPLLPPPHTVAFQVDLKVGQISRLWGNAHGMLTLQPDGLIVTSCNVSMYGPPCGPTPSSYFAGQFMVPSAPWKVTDACTITWADYIGQISYIEYVCLNSTGPHDVDLADMFLRNTKAHENHALEVIADIRN